MSAARPYAQAMFDLATSQESVEAVGQQLDAVSAALTAEPLAKLLLVHPAVRPKEAASLLDALCEQAPLIGNLLHLMFDKGRMGLFSEVAAIFLERADAAAGRVRARVQSAHPLAAPEAAQLREALGRRLGATVEATGELRPELIGGVRVVVGDRVLDASLAGQLAALRRQLLEA